MQCCSSLRGCQIIWLPYCVWHAAYCSDMRLLVLENIRLLSVHTACSSLRRGKKKVRLCKVIAMLFLITRLLNLKCIPFCKDILVFPKSDITMTSNHYHTFAVGFLGPQASPIFFFPPANFSRSKRFVRVFSPY